jgi:ParB family chromosome partitioning protein
VRLLDLPDPVIEMLEQGRLSEGHGRALLLAEDHSLRQSLARVAADEGWSVRVLEEHARESNASAKGAPSEARGATKRGPHPDQRQAAEDIAAALGSALGVEVLVKPTRGGYTAQLTFADTEEALDLAGRVGVANGRPRG